MIRRLWQLLRHGTHLWTRLRREGSEGSKGSEGGGGGFAASFIKKGRGWRRGLCRRVVKGKVLKMDGPSAQGFLSLTALRAEGCGIARRAMSIIMPPFGGHVHIEYHNHSSPRLPLHRSTHSEE